MNQPARKPKPSYAGKVAVRHLVEAARAAGVDVGGIEAAPDGTIRILDVRNMPKPPQDLFRGVGAEGTVKGVHIVGAKAKDGTPRWYVYAWRGGPRIDIIEGRKPKKLSAAQQKLVDKALADTLITRDDTLAWLISQWRRSPEWLGLADRTRGTWSTGLNRIEAKWGKTPLALWNDPRMVAKVVGWRNGFSSTPRAADIGVMVLSRLLEFGRLQASVTVNVAAGIPTIYRGADRADIIWTPDDLDAFCRSALMLDQAHLIDVLYLAAFTGMRRADLAGLTWSEVTDHAIIRIAEKKSKGKRRRAVIPILPETAALLDELRTRPREKGVETVLVNSYGRAWADGNSLGGVFHDIRDHAGITFTERGEKPRPKHLHDLRGTFVTMLCRVGLTDEEVGNIVAWSPQNVASIRRTYVDDAAVVVAIGKRIQASR